MSITAPSPDAPDQTSVRLHIIAVITLLGSRGDSIATLLNPPAVRIALAVPAADAVAIIAPLHPGLHNAITTHSVFAAVEAAVFAGVIAVVALLNAGLHGAVPATGHPAGAEASVRIRAVAVITLFKITVHKPVQGAVIESVGDTVSVAVARGVHGVNIPGVEKPVTVAVEAVNTVLLLNTGPRVLLGGPRGVGSHGHADAPGSAIYRDDTLGWFARALAPANNHQPPHQHQTTTEPTT